MYILGLSCYYHDASAALIKDGNIIAAAEQERFSRKKHDTGFPLEAAEYCLREAGISITDVDHVAFYEKPFLKFERVLQQHLACFPRSMKVFLSSVPSWVNEKLRVMRPIKKKLKFKGDVLFVPHHMAHAAASFLVSPFSEAAVFTVDGVGEWTTTAFGKGVGKDITLLKDISFPHSLGLIYSTLTAYLGFKVNNGEYKCLHPETTVLLSDGNQFPIENLFKLPGKKRAISTDEEINSLKIPITVYALDKNSLNIRPCSTRTVYRKKADSSLFEVELSSGRRVTVTPNHKFTSCDSMGNFYTREAQEISKGDFVAIPRRIRHTGQSTSKDTLWAELLAYSIAEGHEMLRKHKHEAEIRIGVVSETIIDRVDALAKALNLRTRRWNDVSRKYMHHIGVSVWKHLESLDSMGHIYGRKAASKKVPPFVLTGSSALQKRFLSALFDCDGGFVGHQLIYSTASAALAEQLTYLLLNHGIHSRIRRRHNKVYPANTYYRVEISGEGLFTFEENIGFSIIEKRRKLRDFLASRNRIGNNVDFLPINELVLKKWISSGKTKRELYSVVGRHYWDYAMKKRQVTPSMIRDINRVLQDKDLSKWEGADVFFDAVKCVKRLPFKGYVYDVVVPKHHTFIGGGGGIVLHNTMGLSPYGNMDRSSNEYYAKLKKIVDVKEDGSFFLNMEYFIFHYADRMPSQKMCSLLGGPIRKGESELTSRHKDIAAALQMLTEDIVMKILHHVHAEVKSDNLVMGGGVALNSVANGKILRQTPFKNIWIHPAAGDGGTSIGAASYVYHTVLGHPRTFEMKDAYLGPSYSDSEIKKFLDANKIEYSTFASDSEMIEKTAQLIFDNNVIGWFQGRMEWGPRALGSRSILSNPCNPKMQEILNLKVKHREAFRPFAPVICEDDALTYFACDEPIPAPTDYMLMVYPVREEFRSKIPAVTHVDGSGRLQTIRRHQNAQYYDLLKAFGKKTGIPILINTSFNIRGEPIVCEPKHAYKCMMGTGIDYLVMGKFLISHSANKRDEWDSEKFALD